MMQGEYPALPLHWIPKQKRHQRAFGYRHPMEQTFVTGLELDKRGVIVKGVEIMETYTLENVDLAPCPIRINVTRIKRGLHDSAIKYEMVRGTLSQDWHDYILKSCGCEEEHIARLTLEDLKRPAIMIAWDPQLHMTSTIDGSHRICRRWREGMSFFETAFVHYEDVKQHVTMEGRGDGKGRFA